MKVEVIEYFLGQRKELSLFKNGRVIYVDGEIAMVKIDEDNIRAQFLVPSQSDPKLQYEVEIVGFNHISSLQASCNCPYKQSKWCKHAFAALMQLSEYIRVNYMDGAEETVRGHFNPLAFKRMIQESERG